MREVLEIYEDLKVLSNLLNEAFDTLWAPYLLEVLLYYSMHLMDLMIQESIVGRTWLAICTLMNVAILYFAAESCLNVSDIN